MVTPFAVSGTNEERGLPYASYLSQVHIEVYGLRVTMQKSRRLLLDNKRVRTPYEDNTRGFNIYSSGIYTVLETKFGLVVRFDGNHHLEIKLPNTYFGKAFVVLPLSCQSDDREDLDPPCRPEEQARWRARCEELLSAKYQQCHSAVKPAPFIASCVYDLCMYAGMTSTLCNNFQSYVEACRSEGVDLKWRNSTFCPLPCQQNSHYTECASTCPATCTDIYAPATCGSDRPCVEGCECDGGYVLSDDRCVALADCGCVDHYGDYHESGDSWLNERCNTKCTCAKGRLTCKRHKCGENSVCALSKGGKYKCRPV
ncbi:hypothetical protein scyTo_0022960, partial [Scyliorhinus torazame]|nr:hypothetical protein [Scyliorhinus torazame]